MIFDNGLLHSPFDNCKACDVFYCKLRSFFNFYLFHGDDSNNTLHLLL